LVPIVLGLLLGVVGIVLLLDLGGAGTMLIRRVTSRNLGSLAPGYAASRVGFKVYALLVLSLGIATFGLGIAPGAQLLGLLAMGAGASAFVIASAIVIVGEVRTYRALPVQPAGGKPVGPAGPPSGR
jgi:hypothetical protein